MAPSWRGNDRDAIAAKRADPERAANLYERRPGAELRRVRLTHDFADRERARIYLDGFPVLRSLADGIERPVTRPVNVVDAKAERYLVASRRHGAARKAEERLAAPGRNIQRLAVVRELDAVGAGRLAARH